MFVRQKRNRSGSVSIQVIDKTNGYRVVETTGSARDPEQIGRLVELGKAYITRQSGQYPLFPADQQSNAVALDVIHTLENASIRTIGPELILGKLFDEIGFNSIPEELFRDIVDRQSSAAAGRRGQHPPVEAVGAAMAANCQTCGCRMSNPRNRYCGQCAKRVRSAMYRSGYLQDTYVPPYFSEERGRKGTRNMTAVGGASGCVRSTSKRWCSCI